MRVTGGELPIQSGADGIQGGKKGTVGIEGGRTLVSAFNYASADGLYHGVCRVSVYYSFWQWFLIVFRFGWLWYV